MDVLSLSPNVAKCSQMDNPRLGTGQGGDRCTEACGAMVDATYKVSTAAKLGADPETLMYSFTAMLNHGSRVSGLEDAIWISRWLSQQTHNQEYIAATSNSYSGIRAMINRGHIGIAGFRDYVNLRTVTGHNPYSWSDPHGLGHVLIVVGYDDARQAVIVHDPLQGTAHMPSLYSWLSFPAAGFDSLAEVYAPSLLHGALNTGAIGALPAPNYFAAIIIGVLEAILNWITNELTKGLTSGK